MTLRRVYLTMVAIPFCIATSLCGQPYKTVFYHPYEGTMLFQSLADDSGPRAQAVRTLDSNFQGIHNILGATAIVVRLTDESDYVGEGGGGAPYYPLAGGDPKPQFAVAQEIILDVAQKWGLKVFFLVEPSYWHLVEGNDRDGVAPGSWDFIHSLIDPTPYYGNPCTTEMSLVGLADTCVRTYYNDSRVAGWMLGKEWDAVYNNSNVNYYLSTYWNFFYQLVHTNGSTTPAMIYTFGTDAQSGAADGVQYITALKQVFANNNLSYPDMLGFEWYGRGSSPTYDLTKIAADVTTLIQAAETQVFNLPASSVFMSEGGTNYTYSEALGHTSEFYATAIYTGKVNNLGAICVWASDTYVETFLNTYPNVQAPPFNTLAPGDAPAFAQNTPFAMFNATYYPMYANAYPASPFGYYTNGPTGFLGPFSTTYPLSSGFLRYQLMTPSGYTVAEGFSDGGGFNYLYADPNPIQDDGTGLGATTLHFSTNLTSSVNIRAGSPTGPIICTVLASSGPCSTGKIVTDGEWFYLTDQATNLVLYSTNLSIFPYSFSSQWASLSGIPGTAVSVANNGDGRLSVAVEGRDDTVQVVSQTPHAGDWLSWQSLGGSVASVPVIGENGNSQNGDGHLEIFVAGTDGALWHNIQTVVNSSTWSGWGSLGGAMVGNPAVVTNTDGSLEVVVRGTDSQYWYISQTSPGGSSWSGFGLTGSNTFMGNPTLGINRDGRVAVFGRGSDNGLWINTQSSPGGSWSGWTSLGGGLGSDPTVGQNADGRLEVFVLGTGNDVWHIWQTSPGGSWSNWSSLGGSLIDAPVVAQNLNGGLEVFGRGPDNSIQHIVQSSATSWSGWASLGGYLVNRPGVGRNSGGLLDVFAEGGDGALWHIAQSSPGNWN